MGAENPRLPLGASGRAKPARQIQFCVYGVRRTTVSKVIPSITPLHTTCHRSGEGTVAAGMPPPPTAPGSVSTPICWKMCTMPGPDAFEFAITPASYFHADSEHRMSQP